MRQASVRNLANTDLQSVFLWFRVCNAYKKHFPTNATKTGATSGRVQFTKFLEKGDTAVTTRSDYGRNFPIIRYADVLLMYEILNEQAGAPPVEAQQLLNQVRANAKVAPVTPATKEAIRLALENERRWEFAGEGLRLFDLVRTERAIPVMNEFIKSHDIPLANGIT